VIEVANSRKKATPLPTAEYLKGNRMKYSIMLDTAPSRYFAKINKRYYWGYRK